MKPTLKLTTSPLTVLLLLALPQAQAATSTVYAGTTCQPIRPDYDYRRNANGFMYNNSANASYQIWDCPVQRRTANDILGALVVVENHGLAHDVSCTLRSLKNDGSYYYYSTRTATSSGLAHLNFDGLKTWGGSGALTLRCTVPDKSTFGTSGIHNYKIVE